MEHGKGIILKLLYGRERYAMALIVKFRYKSSTNIRFEISAIPLAPYCLEVGDDVFSTGNGLIPNDPVKIIADLDKINGFFFN
jgi:hypothetical protein